MEARGPDGVHLGPSTATLEDSLEWLEADWKPCYLEVPDWYLRSSRGSKGEKRGSLKCPVGGMVTSLGECQSKRVNTFITDLHTSPHH